jgi:hypothetical protein
MALVLGKETIHRGSRCPLNEVAAVGERALGRQMRLLDSNSFGRRVRYKRMLTKSRNRPKLLAVSSGGGHWIQLMRVAPGFEGCDVVFVTVHESYRAQVPNNEFYVVNDASRWSKCALVKSACRLAWIVWKERPDIVFSTGAAPGCLALRLGKMLGARTIWLDSIANVEKLSLSGHIIRRCADLWLTQWAHLARPEGPHYAGSVL